VREAVPSEHVEIVLRNLDAWRRDDIDAWLATAHPDVEYHSVVASQVEGADGVYRGHEGLRRYWAEWRSVWDVNVEVDEAREFSETIVLIGRVRAQGDASGIDLEGPIALVFELEDGLARRARTYFDVDEALRAVER
jgi:ketosteroid isomerase-like protein